MEEKRETAAMERGKRIEDEPKIAGGPHAGPVGETSSRSGQSDQETSMMRIKEEAAGDGIYEDPTDSQFGGLFPGSHIGWGSLDTSVEGLSQLGGAPGPDHCEERASRPGNSRIPGKDHRRYYHSYWRLEYLMDFNPRCHSMICMVCGSSLATLKLSTIKRHIRQKHPYSLNWTPGEKEVIIGSWDAHLCVDAQTLTGTGDELGSEDLDISPQPKKKRRRLPPVMKGVWRPVFGPEFPQPAPPDTSHLEQYLNESLQQWFRVEFLMDYDCQGNQLHCMMCATVLPSLNLADIKHHILYTHPTSLQLSPTQKSVILEAWSNRGQMLEEEGEDEMDEDDEEEEEDEDLFKSDLREDEEAGDSSPFSLAMEREVQENNLSEFDVMEEEIQKNKETMMNTREGENLKAKEGQRLVEEKLNKKETQEMSQNDLKVREVLRIEDEKLKDIQKHEDQTVENDKLKGGEPQRIENEIIKARDVQLLEKENLEMCEAQKSEEERLKSVEVERLERTKETHKLTKHKLELQNGDKIVKIEEEEQQIDLTVEEEIKETEKNQMEIEGQKSPMTLDSQTTVPEEKKKAVEVEKPCVLQLQQVSSVPQTVLGIGLPVLKMESPTPILITRVSVIPDPSLLQSSKASPSPSPSPSLSLSPSPSSSSDFTKSWRVIAPKVSPTELKTPKPTSASFDSSRWPPGVDPMLWEVSLWRGNPASRIQCASYQNRWRSEYLMDYNGLRGSVVCMYCCSSLTVLKESSIRRHIVQKHARTGDFTAEERAAVIHEWETKVAEVRKMVTEQQNDGVVRKSDKVLDASEWVVEEDETVWSGPAPTEGSGASWEYAFGRLQGKAKDPRRYQHDRWKLEYLMDYTPEKDGLICMVCGVTLINPKITTVKMHIQQKHPDTTYLSDQEKGVVMEEWEQKMAAGKKGEAQQDGEDEICIEINEESVTSDSNGSIAENCNFRSEVIKPSSSKSSKTTPCLPPPCNSAKRNYQVRWRTEFMMDYDCRRQGLICMVCGGTLATLKVSTIKRHIVQVHPYSVNFTAEERQRILEAYSTMALHYIHSEDCFKQQPQEEVRERKKKAIMDL
ncbi:zinc finger translocation-associated protein isoform X2 [Spea bombifrons]|uniref:zinc finger translocation-associated protein isoform X2 n=1 Tax=Spea bombifrons TaxID=233779 RepID=UPI00234937F1|nr:zinc finger translocation-associated protein isoform X2 [Spea bombifrons]